MKRSFGKKFRVFIMTASLAACGCRFNVVEGKEVINSAVSSFEKILLTGVAFYILRGVANAKIQGFVNGQIDAALKENKDLSDNLRKQIGNVFKDYVKRVAEEKDWIKATMHLIDRKNELMNLFEMKNKFEGKANALCYIIAMKYYDKFDWENKELGNKIDWESGDVIVCETATGKVVQTDNRVKNDVLALLGAEVDQNDSLKCFSQFKQALKDFISKREKVKSVGFVKAVSEFFGLVDALKDNIGRAAFGIFGGGNLGEAIYHPEKDDIYDFSKYPEGF